MILLLVSVFALTACNNSDGMKDSYQIHYSKSGSSTDYEFRRFILRHDRSLTLTRIVYTAGSPSYYSVSQGTYSLSDSWFEFDSTIVRSNQIGDCGAALNESNPIVGGDAVEKELPTYSMILEGFSTLSTPSVSPLTNACP